MRKIGDVNYLCLVKPLNLTVVLGAKCSDGICFIADKKLTNRLIDEKPEYGDKIFGDFLHTLIGFADNAGMFDIYRRFVVGDYIISKSRTEYEQQLVAKLASHIQFFNEEFTKYDEALKFKIMVVRHYPERKDAELFWIDYDGSFKKVDYKAIGTGETKADDFCKQRYNSKMTMKEFAKYAYFSIKYMENNHPELGVGTEPCTEPTVYYVYYERAKDELAPPEDMNEFSVFADSKLAELDELARKVLDKK